MLEKIKKLTMISVNIRGFNSEEKQLGIGDLIRENEIHVVCQNETKLTIPLYIENYRFYQAMLQRNEGCWTVATKKVKLTFMKVLKTYLWWMRLMAGRRKMQILNCYIEAGDQQFRNNRSKLIKDIEKEIIKQDFNVSTVVCGDFYIHLTQSTSPMQWIHELSRINSVVTWTESSPVVDITNFVLNDGFDDSVTDQNCLKVQLKLKKFSSFSYN
jgi:hypothetical protein